METKWNKIFREEDLPAPNTKTLIVRDFGDRRVIEIDSWDKESFKYSNVGACNVLPKQLFKS
jgi:hypothetical protein